MVGHGGGGGNSGFRNQPEVTANANSQNTWGKGHTGGPSGFGTYVVDGGVVVALKIWALDLILCGPNTMKV